MKLKAKIISSLILVALALCMISCNNLESFPEIIDDTKTSNDGQDAEIQRKSDDVSVAGEPDEYEEYIEYKHIAFTFDDGPHSVYTKMFVDKLAEYGGRATFFVIGNRINDSTAEGLRYALEHGNEIGIHSFSHKHIFDSCNNTDYENELKYTRNNIFAYAGVEPSLMRPPQGKITSERILSSKYPIILWSVDSQDWKHKDNSTEKIKKENVKIIVESVLSSVKDGDIVLMHEIYGNSYEAFSIIIEQLYNQDYRFVTVSELLGESIQSGLKYHSSLK